MIQLDRIDFELIKLLRNNARVSNKELALAVGLAQSTCLVRVRSLQTRSVLKGFYAEVDEGALGVNLQAMVSIRLERHSKSDVEAFRAHALALPEVRQLYHMAGANDFMAQVWVRNSEHLLELVMAAFTAREEVAHIETGLIFEHTRNSELPMYASIAVDDDF